MMKRTLISIAAVVLIALTCYAGKRLTIILVPADRAASVDYTINSVKGIAINSYKIIAAAWLIITH